MSEFSVYWLALREPADAAARSSELVDLVGTPGVIHDLGCGSGSMGRWLSARLSGPLHWRLYDRDPELLRYAAAHLPSHSRDGSPVTVETREADVARLTAADLSGASRVASLVSGSARSLVTASALLDLLTADEVAALAGACVEARCPALFTLSVAGRVSFSPADPLDEAIGEAFNAHQRRTVDGRRLLGPDAVDATVEAFARLGAETVVRPSAWRLSQPGSWPDSQPGPQSGAQIDSQIDSKPDDAALIAAWLEGWVGAAAEQNPSLPVGEYLKRRLETGKLSVVVEHNDLFAVL